MAIQTSDTVAHARLDAVETAIGTSAKMKIFSGAAPANCAAANSGTEGAHFDLPSDYLNAAASRAKTKAGTWQETAATATITAAHFRIYASDGTTCHMQGTVTATGGGGDLTLDNVSIAVGQQVTVTAFTLNEPNA